MSKPLMTSRTITRIRVELHDAAAGNIVDRVNALERAINAILEALETAA